MKKLLALILAMSMALSCLCGGALAAETEAEAPAPMAEEQEEAAPENETEDAPDLSQEASEPPEPEAAPQEGDDAEADRSDAAADAAPAEVQDEEESLSAQAEESVYVLMNIPYGEFYAAEGIGNQVDAVSSATKNKPRTGSLAAGSYHVNSDGTDITGIIFPVRVKQSDLTGCTRITDQSSVDITVTNRGQTFTSTFSGKDALFEAPSYAYYSLGSTLPGEYAAYKEAALTNGSWSFGKVQGVTAQTVSSASAEVDPTGHHTDVEILVTGPTLASEESVSGAILTTSEGKSYGLRHVTEIWRNGYSIGWNYNQPGFSELTGKTITKLTYITQKAVYSMDVNVRVPEYVYALMNIPYSAFYKAELADNSVDVVSSATRDKSRNKGLAGGSYHEADAQGVDGVVYPVKVDKASLTGLTQVTDSTSITLSYSLRGTAMTDTLTGPDALLEAPSYAYYLLSSAPARYKAATLTNGVWTFGKISGRSTASTAELTISTGGHHTYYEFDGPSVLSEGEVLCGVVLTTTDDQTFGLRHVTEIWRNGLQLGWNDTDAGYSGLSGKTIKTIRYITRENVYEVSTNLYVPINASASLSVADALAAAGQTTITNHLPTDFQAELSVKDHADFVVTGNSITFPATSPIGTYTLSVTDKNGKYAPITLNFELKTDQILAVYDAKAQALAAAEGVSAEDFATFLKGITTVSVNGQVYNASGKHAVVIVKEDGSLDLTAAGHSGGLRRPHHRPGQRVRGAYHRHTGGQRRGGGPGLLRHSAGGAPGADSGSGAGSGHGFRGHLFLHRSDSGHRKRIGGCRMKGTKPNRNPALLRRQRQEWFRTGIQAVFFLLAPSVYASAFTAVKAGFSTLSQGLPLTWDAFTLQLVLSFTVLFGRFFCGWACAFGALGDWIYRFSQWIQKKTGRKLPRLSEAAVLRLQWCKYAVLLLILVLCFFGRSALVSRYSPWTVFSLLRSGKLPAGEYLAGWIPMVLILVGMAVQERFFCQFLCPMGAIFALLPQTPFFRLKRSAAACPANCGACRRMCPSALLLDEENPRQGECFRCGRCSGICPRGKLSTCGALKGNEFWLDTVKGAVLLALIMVL